MVLDVVLGAGAQPLTNSEATSLGLTLPADENTAVTSLAISPSTEDERICSAAQDAISMEIIQKTNDQALVSGSSASRDHMQDVLYHVEALRTDQKKHFSDMTAAMDENKLLQSSILEIQQRMHDMQKQTLDRLATIHNRIQAVFTQTFELHEYPIPRLFIVLPKPVRCRNKIGAPFAKQFLLYFLCECGEHTRVNGSRISHEVHLAKHAGYDLNKPSVFFEMYGNYILAMMQMIKLGFATAGIVVPALTDFKIFEGLETVQKGLELGKNTIGALVDETIDFIEDRQSDVGDTIDSADDRPKLDQQEVLEGADLRQLEAYLNVQDEGRTLGNLYRTVTSEGHVKWVCMDHFRATYRDKIMEPLKRFISGNGGNFNEELGIIEKVNLTSQDQAEDLYEAVAAARGITHMAFKLSWAASHGELRALRKAMDKANIMDLAIEGTSFKKAVMTTTMLSRRYQPVLELMSNRRV